MFKQWWRKLRQKPITVRELIREAKKGNTQFRGIPRATLIVGHKPKNWAVIMVDRNYKHGTSCHCWRVAADGMTPIVPKVHESWCPVSKTNTESE